MFVGKSHWNDSLDISDSSGVECSFNLTLLK